MACRSKSEPFCLQFSGLLSAEVSVTLLAGHQGSGLLPGQPPLLEMQHPGPGLQPPGNPSLLERMLGNPGSSGDYSPGLPPCCFPLASRGVWPCSILLFVYLCIASELFKCPSCHALCYTQALAYIIAPSLMREEYDCRQCGGAEALKRNCRCSP